MSGNGGPAFPRPLSHDGLPKDCDTFGDRPERCDEQDGMTLRDYIAAQALAGYRANPAFQALSPREAAEHSYEDATYMLEQRLL